MDFRFDFFFRITLQRARKHLRLAFPRDLAARKMMIVESGFSDRGNSRTFCELAQRRDHILIRFGDGYWMDPDDGEDVRMTLRHFYRPSTARDGSADCDNARDTCIVRPF